MPEPIDPDAALMLRVQQGDMAAFEELVQKYKQPVANLVYRLVQDATECEDIAQHVFLQVHKAAHRYQVTARFSTWIFTIARNLALNELRRRSRHPADRLETAPEDDRPARQYEDARLTSAPDALLRGELEEQVSAAVAALPENQRTALLLFTNEEMPYDEIGQVLGVSLSATKSLIHRARETLKQRLKPYLRTGVLHGH